MQVGKGLPRIQIAKQQLENLECLYSYLRLANGLSSSPYSVEFANDNQLDQALSLLPGVGMMPTQWVGYWRSVRGRNSLSTLRNQSSLQCLASMSASWCYFLLLCHCLKRRFPLRRLSLRCVPKQDEPKHSGTKVCFGSASQIALHCGEFTLSAHPTGPVVSDGAI